MANNTIIRTCNICGTTSNKSKFYHGVTSRCAECHAMKSRENRANNLDYYRAYDAKRFQENPKRKAANIAYAKTPRGKFVLEVSRLKWQSLNPAKRAAHIILGNAVRDKKLIKPKECQVCGSEKGRIHGHHSDYTKPLDVIWCCASCHADIHNKEHQQ